VAQSVTLLGPNAGKAGSDLSRGDEAIIRPAGYEPENTPIISVEADDVTIDGFVLDGFNSEFLTGDYDANGVRVGAAAGVQNGVYPEVVDITGIKIQNNVIRNVSYDGVYLELSLGFDNGFNYIRSNRFENMWEGLQTYAVHSVISDNTFLSCNWGMSLHGTITPAPAGFTPLIASNTLTIAEWWPDTDLPRTNSQAIWINYRRAQAAELDVVGNVINTPVAAPAGRNIRGLYALTVDGGAKVNFIGNTVNGFNNCTHGVYAVGCLPDGAVKVLGGSLLGIKGVGVLARTFDPVWYAAADTYITVSNTTIMTITGGTGIMVHQPVTTPLSKARVTVLDDTTVTGGTVGVRVQGTNAAASIINNSASISGNTIGIYVDGGRAMVERNNLTANTSAGIVAMMGGIVDAGDCTGANITGLGTGSGLNGSSAGLNVLTSYGFDGISPYAVQNNGGVVRAHQNSFGATPVNDISRLMFGVVTYSQAGGLLASCPAPVTVQCVGSIPAGAVTLAQFKALGGNVSCNPATISYVDSPAAPPQGDTVVTRVYTLTDACGTSTSCAQTITVQDSTAPLITAPAAVTLNTDAGSCFVATATVNLGTPVTSDNCGVASVTHNAPAQLPVGQTTVTWTVQDVNGLEATATQVVTVVDYQPPTLVAPAQIVVPTDAGSCFATAVNLGTPTAADNCAAPSLSNNAPAQFPKGATTVTWTATDVNGLTATATQLVVVEDQELPSITLPADVTILNTDSTKPYFTGRATATDNCGQVTVSYTETAYLTNCNATGVIRREWKAQDDADNLALGTQVITIIDSTAPVFASLPANITVDNDVSNCAAVVTFPNLVAVDYAYNQGFENEGFESNTNGTSLDWNDALSHLDRVLSGTDGLTSRSGAAHGLIYSSASLPFKGAFTRMGGSSLTFSKGFKNSLDVYLDIDDFTVAEQTYGFSLSALVNNQQAAPLRSFAFHAASDVNGHILIAADKTPATARREDLASVDHHAVTASGWYTFEWVCRDNAGVLAVDCNLRDASGSLVWTQTLSNPADLIASAVGGNGPVSFNFITPIKLAIDNTRIERFASVDTSVASGTSFPVGTTSVTCTATDACGNSTDTTFTVTVTDNQAPVVECPANIVQATDPDQCGAVVNYTVPAWDNCGIATVVMTPVSGTFLPVGTTQVSVLATDIHGNSQTCSFDVTVADLQAPVLTCPADIVRMVPSDADFASVVFSTPQASDNCGLYNISVSPGSGSGFPLGTNAVVVTAWDTAGNLVSCTFNVAVVRTEGTPIVNVVDYSNNTAAVQVTGYQGLSVVLQASTNLVNWVDIRTNTAPFVHVDAQSTTIPSRFYRAVYKP
ncbi:MAG TPA: HYR domain-containing protein, partial [Clostridia bacterium]|nr:HYR domain-containing protein [Clostridia bacterium]